MPASTPQAPGATAMRGVVENRQICLAWCLFLVTLLVCLWPLHRVDAHPITRTECTEGSQFIMNAAFARDNGLTRTAYLTQLRGDLISIRAFPPELRWFAQDEEDEAFLISAASEVFDDPKTPDAHRQAFLERCLSSPAHHS